MERALREEHPSQFDLGQAAYTQARINHWNKIACSSDTFKGHGDCYRQHLIKVYRHLVPAQQKVLEIGCAQGDLLASLDSSQGVGIDVSEEMISRAKERHPHLEFVQQDAHELSLDEKFDVVILSDLVDDLWDVERVFKRIGQLSKSSTRLILNFYSLLWEKPLKIAERLGLARPKLEQNWLTVEDIANLLHLADFEVIRHWDEFLWPFSTPILNTLFNRYLAKLWPFKIFCLAHFLIARPQLKGPVFSKESMVSVIIPARSEAENIDQIFKRVPEMGGGTELVFVEGHSEDNTYAAIERAIVDYPESQAQLLRQTGKGKGDAVRLGFARAKGEVLMILDADLTVCPEDLPRFYKALFSGKGEFVNGVRLVYPMEDRAMRFFNLVGNKFFSLAFSWLLGQPVKDTLCGTKVLTKSNYEIIAANRKSFCDFDPFGDFDLLFGAAKLNLKIVDLPVRYRERTYGRTNIRRWKHGRLLLRMVLSAARRIKFV